MTDKKYVSGIRPTGRIHLGNYLGAIKQWKELQDSGADCTFFVADLHCQASDDDVISTLRALDNLVLGCNVVTESLHSVWILPIYHDLSRIVRVSQLERMTQYKSAKNPTANLLMYPVLMAADVFYFGGTHVPVGEDQKQHIEFIRDINQDWWPKPEPVIGEYPRIMDLQDATKKMSKSEESDLGIIYIDDTKDVIAKKIRKAKTSINITDDTPETKNLMQIYKACGGEKEHEKWSVFKEELVELLWMELNK
jgi:tryptophanyl-tRNA synthetase